MPNGPIRNRIVIETSVEREMAEIYLNVSFRRPRGRVHHQRRLILTEKQAQDLRDELINAGLDQDAD